MPALTNSKLGSPLGRTGADVTNRCPCWSRKKSRKELRTQAAGRSGGAEPQQERAKRAEERPGGPLSLRRTRTIGTRSMGTRTMVTSHGLQASTLRTHTPSLSSSDAVCRLYRPLLLTLHRPPAPADHGACKSIIVDTSMITESYK